jgi:phosphonate transport system substrate-binding protein
MTSQHSFPLPKLLFSALVLATALITQGSASANSEVLRVSAIPDESPSELQRKFAPLGKYLESETGMKVSFVPVSDYAAVVESLATKKLDLAWLGGFTFVQARVRSGGSAIPIVQREEDTHFTSKFVSADPNIKTYADMKGKVFAFGSPSSTSGHIMPRYTLMKNGINPDKDFKNIAFSGAHDATVAFVSSGKADVGVLNASVWDKLIEQKKVDPAKVHVVATTPPYFDYNWTVRGDLDPVLIKKLTDAFLKLDASKPEQKAILDLQRATKFIPTKKENYDQIEMSAKEAGLIKP